jgi:hypothetical protein
MISLYAVYFVTQLPVGMTHDKGVKIFMKIFNAWHGWVSGEVPTTLEEGYPTYNSWGTRFRWRWAKVKPYKSGRKVLEYF